uniref:Uncharacterized protein n=1 Tax=Aureoumbra lagunensis TaxID=44058 RepID=A0A7S3NPU0_9STRA
MDDLDDDLLFGDDPAATKRLQRKKKKTSKAKDELSLLDAMMAEEKERQKQLDTIRAQTEASEKRRKELVAEKEDDQSADQDMHSCGNMSRASLSPLQIDWDFIKKNKQKDTNENNDEDTTKKKKRKSSSFMGILVEDDDDCYGLKDGPHWQCDEIARFELPKKVMLSRSAAEMIIAKWLNHASKNVDNELSNALTQLAKRNKENELREAFIALSSSSTAWEESHRPWVLAVAALDSRKSVARAAAAAILQSTSSCEKNIDQVMHEIFDALLSTNTTHNDIEEPFLSVERLAPLLNQASPTKHLALRLISDLLVDKSFATSTLCRTAARTFFARCESTIFTDFPVNFSSPAHTLLAIRILPFDVSDGVIQFLSKLLMHLLQDTTFSKILKAQTQQGGLGYLLSALTAMAQDSGGGNAAVPVLGNHASLHIALATIHKLYSYIAPKFSHQEHKLLLKHASDLKQRLRNELDPMAVRTNDIMESFLAGLRRDSEPPVKKQGRLTFTSAKVITAAD